MSQWLVLAHAGEGATWQALVTMLGLGVIVVFLLVVVGRITIAQPDDALLPIAGVAVFAALAPSMSDTLSDWVGWALPAGVAALVGLVLHATTSLSLRPPRALAGGTVGVGALAALVLYGPIVDAWHPPLVFTAQRDDAVIEIVSPTEDEQPSAGAVLVEVAVTGATLATVDLVGAAPTDPEEAARVKVLVDGFPHLPRFRETCTADQPCTSVSFEVSLDPGLHDLSVELLTAEGVTFDQVVFDVVTFEVVPA